MTDGNADIPTHLRQVLTPTITEHGLYLENVTLTGPPNRRVIRVVVDLPDGPGGVGSDLLENVSRSISADLDDVDPITSAYQLEVTTPGVDRPLTEVRHYQRNIGRLVTVATTEDRTQGRITEVSDSDVTLETDNGDQVISFDSITNARVEVELRPRSKGAKRGD